MPAFEVPFDFGSRVIIDDDSSMVCVVVGYTVRMHGTQAEIGFVLNGSPTTVWIDTWRLKAAP